MLFFLINSGFSQIKPGKSRYEIIWAVSHPLCALKVQKIYHQNLRFYDKEYLKNKGLTDSCDGKTDAFRHIFFMALFSQKCSARKIYKLGVAHERKNYRCYLKKNCREVCPSDTLSILMDIQNNHIGIALGKSFKTVSPEMMRCIVIDRILNGKANWVISNQTGKRILTGEPYSKNILKFGRKKLKVLRKFKIRKNNPAI
jgi:hypothetical protein